MGPKYCSKSNLDMINYLERLKVSSLHNSSHLFAPSFLDTVAEINVCYTANVNSPGNDIETRNGITSAEKCQEICENNRDCKYFVYGKTNLAGSCFLKSEKVDHLSQHDGLVFGPKECRKFSELSM